MQTFLHIATTLVIIAHAMLGCCWHHAHHASAAGGKGTHATCCHGHHHADLSDRDESNSDSPLAPEPEPCGELDCVYVLESGTAESLTDATSLDAAARPMVELDLVAATLFAATLFAATLSRLEESPAVGRVSAQKLRAQSQNYRL